MHGELFPLLFIASLRLHFGTCQDLIVPVGVSKAEDNSKMVEFREGCERLCQSFGNGPAYRSCCEQVALFVLKQDFPGQKRSYDPINLYEDEGRFGKRDSVKRFMDDDRFGKRSDFGDDDRYGKKRSPFGDDDRFGKKRSSLFGADERFGKRFAFDEEDRFGKRSAFNDEDRFGKRSTFDYEDRFGKRLAFDDEDRFGKRLAFNDEDRHGKKRSEGWSRVGPIRYAQGL